MNNEFEVKNEISPSPFDKLSESDLIFLLDHDRDRLTDSQVIDIQSRINRFRNDRDQEVKQAEDNIIVEIPSKTYTLSRNNLKKAGYINIAILMLATWITCLCGIAYIYLRIGVMS